MAADTVYYDDERNDEFSGIRRDTVTVDETYPYLRKNPLWRAAAWVVYRGVMKPFAFLWCKLKFGLRIQNKKVLRPYRKTGYFVYANHTLMAGDAFIPNLLDYSKKTYVVVHPDNISAPVAAGLVKLCGGIPTPTTLRGHRPFADAIAHRIAEGASVCIYPEAHIWPYCARIRDFADTSFAYPVRLGAPVFSATVTYQKRRIGRTPRVTVWIDGPYLPDPANGTRVARADLRDRVFRTMRARATQYSTYERIRYRKREETENDGN